MKTFNKLMIATLMAALPLVASAQLFGGSGRCGFLCQIVQAIGGGGGGGGNGNGAPPPGSGDNNTDAPPPPPEVVIDGGDEPPPVPDQEVALTDPTTGAGDGSGDPMNNPDYEGQTGNIQNPDDQGTVDNTPQGANRLTIAMAGRQVDTWRGDNPQMNNHWRAEVPSTRRGDAAGSLLVALDGSNIPAGAYSNLFDSYYTDVPNCSQCMEPGCSAKGVVMNGACACDRDGGGIPYQCEDPS